MAHIDHIIWVLFIEITNQYPLNTEFEQTRAGDDLIRDCVCSGDDKSRLISCQLKRYCKLNGKYIKLNEQEVIETETQEKFKNFGYLWLKILYDLAHIIWLI